MGMPPSPASSSEWLICLRGAEARRTEIIPSAHVYGRQSDTSLASQSTSAPRGIVKSANTGSTSLLLRIVKIPRPNNRLANTRGTGNKVPRPTHALIIWSCAKRLAEPYCTALRNVPRDEVAYSASATRPIEEWAATAPLQHTFITYEYTSELAITNARCASCLDQLSGATA